MPLITREKRVEPALCSTMKRPLRGCRVIGPGVGDHATPDSSSRTKMASEVPSTIGSGANGVTRFSRLFADHVLVAPASVTIVPKCGLAMTLAHGSGVA